MVLRISAVLAGTTSPSLARVTFWLMTTFPPFMAAGMPAAWSLPTIGPGENEVSPASITMSLGARAPALMGMGFLPFSRSR